MRSETRNVAVARLEELLLNGQQVVGVDNFITGSPQNLKAVEKNVGDRFKNFKFIEDDLRFEAVCHDCTKNVDVIFHQAALGSVPRSIETPDITFDHNVNASMKLFEAARKNGVERIVYASSSSVYGDEPHLPKIESRIGHPLSPYASYLI